MSPGDKHFSHTGEGGTNISSHRREGGQTFFTHSGGDKHFYIKGGGQTFLLWGEGGQTFYVRGGGAYDDVDEEVDVSEANFPVSEASKLSAGARIFRGP